MNTVDTTVVLGLGELKASADAETVLSCLGLGSCVAICLYDPAVKVGGMAHMVLPSSSEGRGDASPKFVDVAVPALIGQMVDLGAARERIQARLVGGAQMMRSVVDTLNIGQRNAEAAHLAVSRYGLKLVASDLGGQRGRTVKFSLDDGRVNVTSVGADSYDL